MAFSKSLGIDPREGYADPKLDHLYQPAATEICSTIRVSYATLVIIMLHLHHYDRF